jgi:hypothetical protein
LRNETKKFEERNEKKITGFEKEANQRKNGKNAETKPNWKSTEDEPTDSLYIQYIIHRKF